MNMLTIVRFIHISSAIFWVGTTFFMLFFLEPVIHRAGQAGSRILFLLATETRFPHVIALSGFVTVLAGLILHWQMYGFDVTTMFSQTLPLTIGALAGFLAVMTGSYFQGRSVKTLVALTLPLVHVLPLCSWQSPSLGWSCKPYRVWTMRLPG